MALTRQSIQSTLRSVSTRHGDLNAGCDTSVFYVGLGDQFDDDRRLVRETGSTVRPTVHSFLSDARSIAAPPDRLRNRGF
jgi:hypothetical protein